MTQKRRFLVLTLNAAGNWPPELALVRELARRGHAVRVLSDAGHAAEITEAGAEYRAYRFAPQRTLSVRPANPQEDEMVRVVREVFMNPAYCDELLAEVQHDEPDVLLVDSMLMTALAAAKSTLLPTAVLWHTVYAAMMDGPARMRASAFEPLNALREKLGLAPIAGRAESVEEAHAIIALTYESFDMVSRRRPEQLHYVGPLACIRESLPTYRLPWPRDDQRPLVLVSFSTSFQDQMRTLQSVSDAVAGLPARVLLTLGSAISAAELRLPDNVVAETFVPHAALLPLARLVVTHAGHGTVMAAVTAGVPLLCTPMGRDQFVVSSCVERRGLGVVASMTATAAELRAAIMAALQDESLLERSRSFAAGLDLGAGMRRAVEVLEAL